MQCGQVFYSAVTWGWQEEPPYDTPVRWDSFNDTYESGNISHFAKRIYEVVASADVLPLQEIKRLAGFTKEEKSNFDRALVELQMMMFITVSGRQLKPTNSAWSSAMLCTTERFFGEAVFAEAESISIETAEEKITEQILNLNPDAQGKKIQRLSNALPLHNVF